MCRSGGTCAAAAVPHCFLITFSSCLVVCCVCGCVVVFFPFFHSHYWEINDNSGQMRLDKCRHLVEPCQSVAPPSTAESLSSYVKRRRPMKNSRCQPVCLIPFIFSASFPVNAAVNVTPHASTNYSTHHKNVFPLSSHVVTNVGQTLNIYHKTETNSI